MSRIYLLLLIACSGFIFSCNTESEENKNKRNENWCWWVDDDSGKGMWIPIKNESTVENGRYTLFYFNGNIFEKGTMKDKKKVDTTFFYNPSGKRYAYQLNLSDTDQIYHYKDGNYKIYYNDGSLYCVGVVTNHRQGDQWKVFYKNGKLSSDRKLQNGIGFTTEYFKNGKKKSILYCDLSQGQDWYTRKWYENGQLAFSGDLKDGKYDGLLKKYYENGQVEKIWEMKSGIHEGPSKKYYENGQMEESAWATNGLLQGNAMVWYENGKAKAIMHYKDEKMDGLQKGYHENGSLLCVANMKEGKSDGETRRYDILGNLTSVQLYSNGRRIK